MAVTPARAVAYDVLLRVETKKAYASEVMHAEASAFQKLSEVDRALCMQLVMGVLRWQSRLDEAVTEAIGGEQRFRKLDLEVCLALRLGAFQLGFLERVPARAAVNESVELVKRARKRSAAPLVNAVLRRIAAAGVASRPTSPPATVTEIARAWAHPLWLVEGWAKQYGLANAAAICAAGQEPPPASLRFPPDASSHAALEAELRESGIELAPGAMLRSARRVFSGDITQSLAFREGRIAIQDESSQLVAALVGRGKAILDCCAAPGGKAAAMAERNPGSRVVAVELHPHRARKMRQLVPAAQVEVLQADITQLPLAEQFDRVLADVPCSGTGTLARNPEIKWRLQPSDLGDLHQRQCAILAAALDRVAPGGRLVYSTCSLEEMENEAVVAETLSTRSGFERLDCGDLLRELQANGELLFPDPAALTRNGCLRTLPGVHSGDGFFAAVLQRT